MAFSLTKEELATRTTHIDKLRALATDIETAIKTADTAIEAALEAVQARINDYNAALAEAEPFVEGVAERLEAEYDEKSEKWQDSEKGQDARALVDEWQGGDWTALSDLAALEIDVDDRNHADALENLSVEVG